MAKRRKTHFPIRPRSFHSTRKTRIEPMPSSSHTSINSENMLVSNTSNTHQTAKNAKTVQDGLSAGSVAKRLGSELMQLMISATDGVSAFPETESDIRKWTGTIAGASGTPYAGLKYRISLMFPASYPYTAPTIKFTTPCFHPNVSMQGDICLDILQDKWSAAYSVSTILISLQSLLGEPNNASPLNVEAADLWCKQAEFAKRVKAVYTPIE